MAPRSSIHIIRRRPLLMLTGAVLILLTMGGCRSRAQRADRLEAQADQFAAADAIYPAMQLLRQASDSDGNNVDLWLKLGRLQLRSGDPTGASISFQRAMELAPDNVEALENIAVLSVRGGDYDAAKETTKSLLLLQPNDPVGLMTQGAVAIRERRYADALESADKAIAASPDFAEVFLLRARALAKMGRTGEAIAGLEKRLLQTPGNSTLMLLLLDDYRAMNDVAGIRKTALQLHTIFPDDPGYAIETARADHAQGQDGAAREVLADLQRRHPNSASVAQAIAGYWRDILPRDGARAELITLAQQGAPAVRTALAGQLLDMGFADDVFRLLPPATIARIAPQTEDAAVVTARALAAGGRADEARALIDRVLGFDGTNVSALLTRARLKLAAHDAPGALTDAQLAADNDPTSEAASLLVAQAHIAGGDAVLARGSFAEAVRLWPDSFTVLQPYADWLIAAGRPAEAIAPLTSYVRRHGANLGAWQRLEQACAGAHDPCLALAKAGVGRAGGKI